MFKGIIALENNRGIGIGDKLAWPRAASDLKSFKKLTTGGNVIFGRKTFEGLGVKWLSNRNIFVLSKKNLNNLKDSERTDINAKTFLINDLKDLPENDYWVAGGLSIYNLFLDKLDEFYVTYIKGSYKCDTFIESFEHKFTKSEILEENERFKIVKYVR